MVRAKFVVTDIKDAGWHDSEAGQKNIELLPVGGAAGGESEENKAFYAVTPGGSINLGVLNAAAAAQFEVGQEYYVDFTRAEVARREHKQQRPSVGRMVHFVYGDQHFAATITAVHAREIGPDATIEGQALTVFPPGDQPFTTIAIYDAAGAPGTWHWPEFVSAH